MSDQRQYTPVEPEERKLANAVYNYLGIRTAEEFATWYKNLRDDIDRADLEAWKR